MTSTAEDRIVPAADPRTTLRLEALTGWAAESAARGHIVPAQAELEAMAVANAATADGVSPEVSDPWIPTVSWLLQQTRFGVKAAHLQLPDELYHPVGWNPAPAAPVSPALEVIPEAATFTPEPPPAVQPTDEDSTALASASGPKVPKWETTARAEVIAAVEKFTGPLRALIDRDANEGDTRLLITDMLCEGLGYDKFSDLTTEFRVKQDFADYGVRIDKQLVAFIEVKRVSQKLNERHLRQVQMYAVNEGVEWMVLTNGRVWQAYHLTGGLPVIVNLALEVDLLGPESVEAKSEALFFLHKEALKRRRIDELWKHRAATAPDALLDIILSEAVLGTIRKEVKRGTGITTTNEAIADVIREGIVDPKVLAKYLLQPGTQHR